MSRQVLSENPFASLNTVAKQAGVGPGTLYRHFPTREALVLAVYEHEIENLADTVADLLDRHAPLDALRVWFLRLAGYVRIKHGLGEALHSAPAQDVVDRSYAPVTGAIATLLAAGVAAGEIRDGIEAGDVLLVMSALWRVGPGEAGDRQAEHILELAIAGLRPR